MKLSTKLLTRLALLAAASILLGKILGIPFGNSIRISFENLPVLLAGYSYGPIAGVLCGIVADLVGCFIRGFEINPWITAGAASIGFLSGMFGKNGFLKKPQLILAVFSSHIVGSILLKSLGLYIYYATRTEILLFRIPQYLVTAALECFIIYSLFSSKAFCKIAEV